MNEKLVIAACNFLIPEIAQVIKNGDYPEVQLISYPVNCSSNALNSSVVSEIASKSVSASDIILIGSFCHSPQNSEIQSTKDVKVVQLEQCFELILNPETIYHFVKQGYYIVTNGWLRTYERNIHDWGFDKASARSFFQESMKSILLLDTKIPGDYMPNLLALSEYMGLPYEIIPVGLTHCKKYIDSVVLNWRTGHEHIKLSNKISAISKQSADYKVIFNQLETLVLLTKETEIIQIAFELINILFAPSTIVYKFRTNGREESLEFKGFFSNIEFNAANTFHIDIKHTHELLGTFEVKGLQFPQFKKKYEEMGVVISQIFGMAIANARKYSELEQTKLLISESEKQYRSLFDNMHDSFALHEIVINKENEPVDYTFIEVNDAFEKQTGLKRENIIGHKVTDILPGIENDPTGWIQLYGKVALTGESVRFESFAKPIGKWYNINAYCPKKGFFATIFEDITQRKLAEEQIRKLSTAVEQSPVSVVITDTDGNIEYGNQTVFDLTGYTPAEVLGKNPRIFSSGEMSKREYENLWNTILSGEIWQGEFHNKKKNGELYWERASISAIKNSNGETTNFLAIKTDVTEFKNILLSIEKSEEKYRLITDFASDVIWVLNLTQMKFTFISPSIIHLRGYSVEEAMAQGLEESLTPESALTVRNSMEEAITKLIQDPKAENFYINEIQQPCKDGRIIWVEVSTKFKINKNGEIEVIGVSRNIDERKQTEKELRESASKLSELNATKDKFFSIIAHDLKGPFNSLLGFSELLKDEIENGDFSEVSRLSSFIHETSNKNYDLLLNLLEWSRSQTGKIKFNPESLKLADLVDNIIELSNNQAEKKGIALNREIPGDLKIFADKYMLETILRNLVSNAIKFTPKKGEIIVRSIILDDVAKIMVSDSGIGIRSENIEKLFSIDSNISTNGTDNEKGTGLGLILCKEFVSAHGGEIWAESEIGKGSTFYFTIPSDR